MERNKEFSIFVLMMQVTEIAECVTVLSSIQQEARSAHIKSMFTN